MAYNQINVVFLLNGHYQVEITYTIIPQLIVVAVVVVIIIIIIIVLL
jgi:hypothetical protein